MINIVTSVVGELADRVSALHGDVEMIRTVSSQSFEHAPGVQANHDVLIGDLSRWRDTADQQLTDLGRALEVIHQAFTEADQAMAAAWDVNL